MVTYPEIYSEVAERVGADVTLAKGFIQTYLDVIKARLDNGEDISLMGIGTLKWTDVQPQIMPIHGEIPAGVKLKFQPNDRFRPRRYPCPKKK